MPTNSPKKTPVPQNQPQLPRWRLGWIWLLLAIISLIWSPSMLGRFSGEREISWQQFEKDILPRKAVEKIEVADGERAEVFLKKEFAADSQFVNVFKQPFGKGPNAGPHFVFNIGSVETFEKKLDEAQRDLPISEKST